MTFISAFRSLMGTGYELINPASADAPAPVTYRQIPLDQPAPELAREEQTITNMRRAALVSDVPVLAPSDPTIQQASFRNRFDVTDSMYEEMNHWTATALPKNEDAHRRSVLALGEMGDAPVLAAPLVVPADEVLSVGVRKFRQSYGWIDDRDYPIVPRAS